MLFYLKKIVKMIKEFCFLVLISLLMKYPKRNKKLILFSSAGGYSFNGNPKYVFNYFLEKKEKNIFWITKNKEI